jgi:hypothetical protein
MPFRLFDTFALVAVLATSLLAWPYGFGGSGGRVLYVAPHGSDWFSGTSAAWPMRTIQRAADRVRPGDTVRIMAGVYQERVHLVRGGRPGRRVRFVADTPGSVILDWSRALTGLDAPWTNLGDGIHGLPMTTPVYRMTCDDQTMFRVNRGGLSRLRELTVRPGAFPAFCWESATLYMYLPDGKLPEQCRIITHRPVPEPREWGEFRSANLWVEADHIEIHGMQFKNGIGSSILLWNAEDVVIRDCVFTGASVGVRGNAGRKPARDVRVERCLYHNYPQGSWLRSWLSWLEIYAVYSCSSLVHAVDEGTEVRECLALHVGDGLYLSSRSDQPNRGLVATNNWLAFGTDDAIEFDGPGCHITFRRNLVLNFYQSLGVSPVTQGPTRITENLLLHPNLDSNGSNIKLLGHGPQPDKMTIRNVQIDHNFVFGNWLCWWGETPVEDLTVHDNLFAVRQHKDPIWPTGVTEWSNSVAKLDPDLDDLGCVHGALEKLREAAGQSERERLDRLVEEILSERPGPSWWDDDRHPATRRLRELVGYW